MPAAFYALLPNLKHVYILPTERGLDLLSPVPYTATPKCVFIWRVAGARHISPVVL